MCAKFEQWRIAQPSGKTVHAIACHAGHVCDIELIATCQHDSADAIFGKV